MTQAMNLANFSNSVDASGQIAPTVLNAAVPISKGGTASTTAAAARAALDVPQAVYAVPSGGIIMWSGSIATIPTGWLLCNGSSGTPDLRNRFIIGAYLDNAGVANTTITGANTQTGGSKDAIIVSHTHTITDPTHSHTQGGTALNIASGNYVQTGNATQVPYNSTNTNAASTGITINSAGSSGTNANLNPYYALAFIMKS
jgi:microcystin-dependent protein